MSYQDYKAGQSQALDSSSTQEVGIGGFTLFARVSDSTAYETQSPTSTVEDGSYIGDHLINGPIKINISGEVADVFVKRAPVSASQSRLPAIAAISSFLPRRTQSQMRRAVTTAISASNQYNALSARFKAGLAGVAQLTNGSAGSSPLTDGSAGRKSIREQFIDFIESIHYGRQLVTIGMPFRKHENMVINSVTITRDNQRNALTFTLTAQKFRIAKTVFSDVSQFYKKPAPAVKSQVGPVKDKGVQTPKSGAEAGAKKEKSLATALFGR